MNPSDRRIAQEPEWDARVSVDRIIESAIYAIIRPDEVVLVLNQKGTTLQGVVLTNENGLHYDADTTIGKNYAQDKIVEGDWELSMSWPEQHLENAT
jgi:hypothetical protein